jgi:hypothetical protein
MNCVTYRIYLARNTKPRTDLLAGRVVKITLSKSLFQYIPEEGDSRQKFRFGQRPRSGFWLL